MNKIVLSGNVLQFSAKSSLPQGWISFCFVDFFKIPLYLQFSAELYQSGIHTLSLSVLSSLSIDPITTTLQFSIIHPITHIAIFTKPVVRGNQSEFLITVEGGLHFDFRIRFDDGTPEMFKSSKDGDMSNVNRDQVVDMTSTDEVKYTWTLYHLYAQVGRYCVTVNATNHVSWMESEACNNVEEPISGVHITYTGSRIIQVGQNVTITGTVDTGQNLKFEWDFSAKANAIIPPR